MMYRTDLAVEAAANEKGENSGVSVLERKQGCYTITIVDILTEEASVRLQKPVGRYCTIQLPAFSDHFDYTGEGEDLVAQILQEMLPKEGNVLIMGLGNRSLTADALGPLTADKILATRHIQKELGRVAGLTNIRPVSVCSPGVLGMTGMETQEILAALVKQLHPAAVIAVDALAASELGRMGCTVQITDSGIAPGSGVGNHRPQLNRETVGVPVIGLGVPTVIDGSVLARELLDKEAGKLPETPEIPLTITVREIDLLVSRAAALLSMAINRALNPSVEEQWFRELTE